MDTIRKLLKRKRQVDQETDTCLTTTVADIQPSTTYPDDFAPRLIILFERLQTRDQQPVFPYAWQADFPNLPSTIFLNESSDQGYAAIKVMAATESSEFRGKIAIERMLCLGRSVRDTLNLGPSVSPRTNLEDKVEKLICQVIKRFIHWLSDDARVTADSLALFVRTYRLSKAEKAFNESAMFDVLSAKVEVKMREAAKIHRDSANKSHKRRKRSKSNVSDTECMDHAAYQRTMAASIYGVAICGHRVALAALNVRMVEAPIRTLLALDFRDPAQDLWSILGILLLLSAAREERLDHANLQDCQDLNTSFSKMKVIEVTVDKDM